MSDFAFRKIIFSKEKLIMRFPETHLDRRTAMFERKSLPFFWCEKNENHWFYTVIPVSIGLWHVHFFNVVQTKPHFGSSNIAYKTCVILIFCSKRPKNDDFQIFGFWLKFIESPHGPPRAPGSAREPHEMPPMAPTSIKINANRSLTHSLTHSLTDSLTHSITHPNSKIRGRMEPRSVPLPAPVRYRSS